MKIYDFVNERDGRVLLKPLPQPTTDWDTPLAAFKDALKHEQHVTQLINELVALATKENGPGQLQLPAMVCDEQVEEESIVDEAIQDLNLVGDFGPGLFLLDRELGAAPPAEEGA